MKKIDGIDEDVWFEHVAADVLSATTPDNWQSVITAHVAPLLPKIEAVIDAHTATIAEDIVAYMIIGALDESHGDVPSAIASLRE